MAHHHSPRFLRLVKDAKRRIKEISAAALRKKLQADESFYLLDVREEQEWATGRIPGAQHLCKGILERDIEVKVPDFGAPIILYCGGGYRSALAADNLRKMGYRKALSLAGGWRGWLKLGYPVTKDEA